MSDEEKQSTDTENQVNDGMNIDFGDEEETTDKTQSEEPSAESPEEQQTPESKEESFINQEAVNKRINEITFQKYEEKRKREQLETELNQLRLKLEDRKKESEDIPIPPLPDPYDDDYSGKIKAREQALQQAAELKARKTFEANQKKKAMMDQLEAQNATIKKQVETMFEKGKKHGISEEDLREADRTVSNFIKDQSLARFILAQDDAALIVKYLSTSATELEKLSSMDPLSASVHIATKVAQKAVKIKPGLTKTPDPIDIPSGKSAPKEDPYLKGVSFE